MYPFILARSDLTLLVFFHKGNQPDFKINFAMAAIFISKRSDKDSSRRTSSISGESRTLNNKMKDIFFFSSSDSVIFKIHSAYLPKGQSFSLHTSLPKSNNPVSILCLSPKQGLDVKGLDNVRLNRLNQTLYALACLNEIQLLSVYSYPGTHDISVRNSWHSWKRTDIN